ncbi:MAG: sigma 54-interacting transcriptional regulator [Spirochaetales bacterium]|nr:sigma 54-interacting transcriptional regulator [Spirochaetales bacterium]
MLGIKINTSKTLISRKSLTLLLIILSCFFLTFLLAPFFESVNIRLNDQFFKLRYAIKGKERAYPGILQVNINDSAVQNLDLSLWDRNIFGRLIGVLDKAGARAIALDMVFQEKSLFPEDSHLVDASCRSGKVYFPVVVNVNRFTKTEIPITNVNNHLLTFLKPKLYWQSEKMNKISLPKASVMFACFQDLIQCSRGLGHINNLPDEDGINRRFPLFFMSDDENMFIPSLALRLVCDYLDISEDDIEINLGQSLLLKGALFPEGYVEDISIPLDKKGQIIINWQGPWDDSFAHLSLEKLLAAENDPKLMGQLKNLIGDAIVLISDVSTRNKDHGPGVFERIYPLSGIHMNVMNSILSRNFIVEPGFMDKVFIMIFLAVVMFVFSLRVKSLGLLFAWACLFILFYTINFLIFMFFSRLAFIAAPSAGLLLAFISVNAYGFFITESEKMKLRAQTELEVFRREFMSTIAHEIKTPLSLILGPLDQMSSYLNNMDDKQINAMAMVKRNSYKLLYLVNQFLHVSKIEARKISLKTQKEDFVDFLKQKVYNFGYLFNQKTIKTLFNDNGTAKAELYLDMEKIDIVFNNLFLNAYKYIPHNGCLSVTLSSILPSDWNDEVKALKGTEVINVLIQDNGPGIPEDQQKTIFDKYQRGNKLSVDGTGIGLYIAKKYVELHHGCIFLKSQKNKGARFLIQLPCGRSHLEDSDIQDGKKSKSNFKQDLDFRRLLENYSRDSENNLEIKNSPVKLHKPIEAIESKASILIAEDDPDMRAFIKSVLEPFYLVYEAVDGKDAFAKTKKIKPDLILSDLRMPELDGYEFLKKLKKEKVTRNIPFVLLSVTDFEEFQNDFENQNQNSVESVTPDEYLSKPFSSKILLSRVNNILTLTNQTKDIKIIEATTTLKNPDLFSEIITANIKMKMLFKEIEALAPTKAPVLITGETGTGKELIAALVHKLSGQEGNFRAINIAAENPELISDKLFGHEKGAFTGAEKERDGILSEAKGGSVFLDEIGDMSYDTQVKLLRVIDPGYYQKLGSAREIKCEARIIAATNRPLLKRMEENKFHQDLYNRFLIKIHVPPLRERRDDLPLLFYHFFQMAADDFKMGVPTVSHDFISLFKNYSFPNNIRDIKSMVWEAFSKYDSAKGILFDTFKDYMLKNPGYSEDHNALEYGKVKTINFSGGFFTLDEVQDLYIQEVYRKTNHNVAATAQILGREQSVIYKRLKNIK